MANTTATLALCALSMNDYAAAADFSRCHLKLFGQESNQKEQPNEVAESTSDPNLMMQVKQKQKEASGKSSIVAMWVIRGRAMIGLGCPYLASLHFNQVKSLRSSFPKIEVILAALQDAQVLTAQHTSSIGLMTLQVPLPSPLPCPNLTGGSYRIRSSSSLHLASQLRKQTESEKASAIQ